MMSAIYFFLLMTFRLLNAHNHNKLKHSQGEYAQADLSYKHTWTVTDLEGAQATLPPQDQLISPKLSFSFLEKKWRRRECEEEEEKGDEPLFLC